MRAHIGGTWPCPPRELAASLGLVLVPHNGPVPANANGRRRREVHYDATAGRHRQAGEIGRACARALLERFHVQATDAAVGALAVELVAEPTLTPAKTRALVGTRLTGAA